MEQQGDPLSEDKTEKLGDFMRRVKDDTVLNLYFVTETGSKKNTDTTVRQPHCGTAEGQQVPAIPGGRIPQALLQ